MDFSAEEFDEILSVFKEECDEIVQKIDNNLVNLEKDSKNKDVMDALFRDIHSLKGAVRMIGFNNIQNLLHKIEDMVTYLKEYKLVFENSIADCFYSTFDFIKILIDESIKNKSEYISDEYNDYEHKILDILNNSFAYSSKDIDSNTFNSNNEICLKKDEIDAYIIEILFILSNLDINNQNLDVLYDLSEKLLNLFEQTSFYNAKELVKNITFKLMFTVKGTGALNTDEIDYINHQLNLLIDEINKIYTNFKLETIDYYECVKQKNINSEYIQENFDSSSYKKNDANLSNKVEILVSKIKTLGENIGVIPVIKVLLKEICACVSDSECVKIADKISQILDIIAEQNQIPDKEIVNVIKQCVYAFEDDSSQTVQEDKLLLLQRLSIIEQMLNLNFSKNKTVVNNNSNLQNSSEYQRTQDFFKTFENVSIKTLRVDTKKLDKLVNQVGELIVSKIKEKNHLKELEKLNLKIDDMMLAEKKFEKLLLSVDKKQLNNTDKDKLINYFRQLNFLFSEFQYHLLQVSSDSKKIQTQIKDDNQVFSQIVDELERMVKNIRLLPFATIFHMFPRMVRDIAEEKNKEVELYISGSDTTTDKKVIEEIKSPLIHIIRNSIDHGIESPEERIAMGKSRVGSIRISAKQDEHKIILTITDDGAGINIEKIKDKAIQKGLVSADEINNMSDEQIINFLFIPGFSTGDSVTEISGRGIGLDIVQSKITQLDGKIHISSVLNQGTSIIIELPISMATVNSLIVKADNTLFAFPINSIKSVLMIKENDIKLKDNKQIIYYNKTVVPIYDFGKVVLGKNSLTKKETGNISVVLIETDKKIAGFMVDELIGDQEILHKKLSPPVNRLKNISGISTLASGKLCLIVNTYDLLNSVDNIGDFTSSVTAPKDINQEKSNFKILVVDDSLTTRTLLQNILKDNDYDVVLASNGKEAVSKLSADIFDLVITDMQMPEMNGLELIRYMKSNELFAEIPIIVVTSKEISVLDSEYKLANLVINKLDFNQNILLKNIKKLIKKPN